MVVAMPLRGAAVRQRGLQLGELHLPCRAGCLCLLPAVVQRRNGLRRGVGVQALQFWRGGIQCLLGLVVRLLSKCLLLGGLRGLFLPALQAVQRLVAGVQIAQAGLQLLGFGLALPALFV